MPGGCDYDMPIKRLVCIIAFLLIAGSAFATDYYIDLDDAGSGSAGTYADPWSWADFVGETLSASHDYRFLCGSDVDTSGTYTIDVTGNGGGDNVILGAYYMDGGSPVHEDDSPTFGSTCGNSATKPTFKRSAIGTGAILSTVKGSSRYIEFNSLYFKDAQTGLYLSCNDNTVRYCYIYNVEYGLRVGNLSAAEVTGDDNLIEYNFFDLNTTAGDDEGAVQGDCITLGYWDNADRATGNTVQYNHCTGFDHGGVAVSEGDENIIQYNYFYESANSTEDFCVGLGESSADNIFRFNFCKDAGQALEIMGGVDNEIYGNIGSCDGGTHPSDSQGCYQIQSAGYSGYPSTGNKIYNNVVYDHDDKDKAASVWIVSNPGNTANVSDNYFTNNILLKTADNCIRVYDGASVIGTNYFTNNSCYDFATDVDCVGSEDPYLCCSGAGTGSCGYANVEGTVDDTASDFNTGQAFASDNRDDDPGVEDAASYEFWPDSSGSNIVGTGYDLGSVYDDLLDPDTTEFTATPPEVDITPNQPASWYIGAYEVSGAAPPAATQQLQGISLQGVKIN